MKAARLLRFGPPSVITYEELPRPDPGAGQLLVRARAAGVGNWDALIREGKVQLQTLPLILGSELSGIVEGIGPDVSGFKRGDEVHGGRGVSRVRTRLAYGFVVIDDRYPRPRAYQVA